MIDLRLTFCHNEFRTACGGRLRMLFLARMLIASVWDPCQRLRQLLGKMYVFPRHWQGGWSMPWSGPGKAWQWHTELWAGDTKLVQETCWEYDVWNGSDVDIRDAGGTDINVVLQRHSKQTEAFTTIPTIWKQSECSSMDQFPIYRP